ncbi:MAG: thymidine phosphorylase [Bacilli bacterium]|nr:thymidine phosphorylase [Bacilli bacterium]
MNICDIIVKKRNKEELTKDEINFVIENFTNGIIPEYQMSSLLMAIFLNGMSDAETFNLTEAMINSGDILSYGDIDGMVVDKHSTGGIGDKTTLIIVPIVAALGCKVAKMSGRGLGFTGGTIDKLESIEGFNVNLDPQKFRENIKNIGAAIISQTGNLTPADKKIYALRDVTGTVESIPLIASSIMSKKIASGADVIVLDVKVGSGAFMKTLQEAEKLAETMVNIGKHFNRKVVALITNMDAPLGNDIGNKLEVQEAYKILNNEEDNDLKTLCIELATMMSSLALEISKEEARARVVNSINNKTALTKLKEIVEAQGGNFESVLQNKNKAKIIVKSNKSGYISHIDAESIGSAAMMIGAGRKELHDEIDYEVGVILNKTIGDYISINEVLATLYINDETHVKDATNKILSAIELSDSKVLKEDLIYLIIE